MPRACAAPERAGERGGGGGAAHELGDVAVAEDVAVDECGDAGQPCNEREHVLEGRVPIVRLLHAGLRPPRLVRRQRAQAVPPNRRKRSKAPCGENFAGRIEDTWYRCANWDSFWQARMAMENWVIGCRSLGKLMMLRIRASGGQTKATSRV